MNPVKQNPNETWNRRFKFISREFKKKKSRYLFKNNNTIIKYQFNRCLCSDHPSLGNSLNVQVAGISYCYHTCMLFRKDQNEALCTFSFHKTKRQYSLNIPEQEKSIVYDYPSCHFWKWFGFYFLLLTESISLLLVSF